MGAGPRLPAISGEPESGGEVADNELRRHAISSGSGPSKRAGRKPAARAESTSTAWADACAAAPTSCARPNPRAAPQRRTGRIHETPKGAMWPNMPHGWPNNSATEHSRDDSGRRTGIVGAAAARACRSTWRPAPVGGAPKSASTADASRASPITSKGLTMNDTDLRKPDASKDDQGELFLAAAEVGPRISGLIELCEVMSWLPPREAQGHSVNFRSLVSNTPILSPRTAGPGTGSIAPSRVRRARWSRRCSRRRRGRVAFSAGIRPGSSRLRARPGPAAPAT